MCSAMVLPTLGRTLFRNSEPQHPSVSVGSGIAAADTLGKPEPHSEYDFYNLASGGLDMDSDMDVSNSIGHILTSLGSQLGRGADPAPQDSGYGGHWSPTEDKRICEPIWSTDLHQHHHHQHHQHHQHHRAQRCFSTSDSYASSPDHYSDSGAELLDSDTDVRTPPQSDCLPAPPPPPPPAPPAPTLQLRPRVSSHEDEEDALLGLQQLHGLQPLQAPAGLVGPHAHTHPHDVDIEKMMTDYLSDLEDVTQQAARIDELDAALARVSCAPSPPERRPMAPPPAPERPCAAPRWAGAEGGSSILEGVLRGTLSPATRVTASPGKPLPHCYPGVGFPGYSAGPGAELRGPSLTPAPARYPGEAGSPGRLDCALSPVSGPQDVFGSGGPLTSPQTQNKKDGARKRKYAKRTAAEGEAPPSRGRLLHFCHICSKGFKDKYSVNVHIRTHTGEKPFQCHLCSKCFRQKAHLAKHVHIHSSPKTPPAKR